MKVLKFFLTLVIALTMAMSSLLVVSAKTTYPNDGTSVVTITDDNDENREYELEWRYYKTAEHLYKRRWNCTLGVWYDPYWILVY